MYADSTGNPIKVGDRVRFRGQAYTIKRFEDGCGRSGIAKIIFEEDQHTDENADE